jgi:hypothetical protein
VFSHYRGNRVDYFAGDQYSPKISPWHTPAGYRRFDPPMPPSTAAKVELVLDEDAFRESIAEAIRSQQAKDGAAAG